MSKPEKVTVVIPVYNAARFLEKTVASVINQSYSEWELLLVDDGSSDNSLEIACKLAQQDSRIKVIISPKNEGVAKARNRGIQRATGKYIALLDSDDVWALDKLERQIKLAHQTGAEILYGSYDFMDEKDRPIKKPFVVPQKTNYEKMLSNNVISCSTVMVEANLLKEHPFPVRYYHEDYVLWMQLLKLPIQAVGDPAVLAHYRQVVGSRSNNKKTAARQRWIVYRRALGMNLFESAWAFMRYGIHGILKYYR